MPAVTTVSGRFGAEPPIMVSAPDSDLFSLMAPRTPPNSPPARPSAEDEADIRTALAELEGGRGVELTADELRHWEETGEWHERLG
jgi:hypothetical protein